jgi:hypothetical protein
VSEPQNSPYPIATIPAYALPPFVQTPEDRERWELSVTLAETTSRQNEPDGRPNSMFVWYFARSVYHSDIPTGSPDDPAAPVDALLA